MKSVALGLNIVKVLLAVRTKHVVMTIRNAAPMDLNAVQQVHAVEVGVQFNVAKGLIWFVVEKIAAVTKNIV